MDLPSLDQKSSILNVYLLSCSQYDPGFLIDILFPETDPWFQPHIPDKYIQYWFASYSISMSGQFSVSQYLSPDSLAHDSLLHPQHHQHSSQTELPHPGIGLHPQGLT